MKLRTERLSLRQFCIEDAAPVLRLSHEPGMRRWIPDQVYRDESHTQEVLRFLIAQ